MGVTWLAGYSREIPTKIGHFLPGGTKNQKKDKWTVQSVVIFKYNVF